MQPLVLTKSSSGFPLSTPTLWGLWQLLLFHRHFPTPGRCKGRVTAMHIGHAACTVAAAFTAATAGETSSALTQFSHLHKAMKSTLAANISQVRSVWRKSALFTYIYTEAVWWLACNVKSSSNAPYLLLKLTLVLLKNKEISSVCCFPGSQVLRMGPERCQEAAFPFSFIAHPGSRQDQAPTLSETCQVFFM